MSSVLFLTEHLFHEIAFILAIPISLFSLINGYKLHLQLWVLATRLVGLTLMGLGLFSRGTFHGDSPYYCRIMSDGSSARSKLIVADRSLDIQPTAAVKIQHVSNKFQRPDEKALWLVRG